MNRRTFLQRLIWGIASATAVRFSGPRTLNHDCVFVSYTPAPLHMVDDNWWAWRERLYQMGGEDYSVLSFTLAAEEGGYRQARVKTLHCFTGKTEVHVWDQPWSREAHYRENIHLDFGPCNGCGAKTKTVHAQHCKFTTALAHRLGPNLDGFKVESDLITAPTKEHRGPWES